MAIPAILAADHGPDPDWRRCGVSRPLPDDDLLWRRVGGHDISGTPADELDVALSHLRAVHASYWDHHWRRDHRGLGRYPENDLWEAVDAYLELRDAANSQTGSDG